MDGNKQWQSCPAGVVSEMAQGLRNRRRRQTMLKVGSGGALGLVLIGFLVTASVLSDRSLEEMTCDRAVSLFADYRDGQLGTRTHAQLEAHLGHCPRCRDRFRRQYLNDAHRLDPVPEALAACF